jgi:hypothetical protein
MEAVYITSKIDNNEYCKSNGQFTKHLRKNNFTYREYYEKYITCIKEKCPFCQKPKQFYQKDHTYADTCGKTKCVGLQISKVKESYTEKKWDKQREAYQKQCQKNLIIEVKSEWWYNGYGDEKYKSRLENNLRKRQACVNKGYDFEFWIWDNKNKEFKITK